MNFEEILADDMVLLGGPETVANAILRLASRLDLMGLVMIFKLGAMPYDMVERSMTAFGEEVVPRIHHLLNRDAAAPALHVAEIAPRRRAAKSIEEQTRELVDT
jgi:hypothetical protein